MGLLQWDQPYCNITPPHAQWVTGYVSTPDLDNADWVAIGCAWYERWVSMMLEHCDSLYRFEDIVQDLAFFDDVAGEFGLTYSDSVENVIRHADRNATKHAKPDLDDADLTDACWQVAKLAGY